MRIPAPIRHVAEVIGMDAAIRLSEAAVSPRGSSGARLYVPSLHSPKPSARLPVLQSVLSASELQGLRERFGGATLHYPSARHLRRKAAAIKRAQAINDDLDAGMTWDQVAARHQVSRSYVGRVRAKAGR